MLKHVNVKTGAVSTMRNIVKTVDKFLVTNMIISIRTQTVEVYGQVIEEM
jgi:hypothetical protein